MASQKIAYAASTAETLQTSDQSRPPTMAGQKTNYPESTKTTIQKSLLVDQSPPLSTQSTIALGEDKYHVLTHKEKYSYVEGAPPTYYLAILLEADERIQWMNRLTLLVSLAATFSPLASNIYFPAINQISEDLSASHSAVAMTVTTYMYVTSGMVAIVKEFRLIIFSAKGSHKASHLRSGDRWQTVWAGDRFSFTHSW